MLLLGAEEWTTVSSECEHSLMRSDSAAGALIKFMLGSKLTLNDAKNKTKKLFYSITIAELSTSVRYLRQKYLIHLSCKREKKC